MKKILITGGAGFIGINAAIYFFKKGYEVTVLDNLSRRGTPKNKSYLQEKYPKILFTQGDIRDFANLQEAVKGKDIILHLAGQVAVTTSIENPRDDYEINALGTFNVLESMRLHNPNAIILYSSTNKVYGGLENIPTKETEKRYNFEKLPFGVSESQNLDFHSPYGCSKGAADQYVRDYARVYGLKTIVFRQSCIYGPHQFGVEDQGWVAWFLIAAIFGKPITIYGNGKQVRDILYITDLVKAFDLAIENIDRTKGQIYNIGGGHKNTISIWKEFKEKIESLLEKKITADYSEWRVGDQPLYISDIRKAKRDFAWSPEIDTNKGIEMLYDWILKNRAYFKGFI